MVRLVLSLALLVLVLVRSETPKWADVVKRSGTELE
jgi:hypothetical protein